jgi:ABC-type polysaccharide/polyol phosphate export permease
MYSAPIVYPLSLMPTNIQKIILWNPFAFIIQYAKQALISNGFAPFGHFVLLLVGVVVAGAISFWIFRKYEKTVAELI